MDGFARKIFFSLFCFGSIPALLVYYLAGHFSSGALTAYATFFILIGVAICAVGAKAKIVAPLMASMKRFDSLIEGRTGETGAGREVSELRRVRKALQLLVTEQTEARSRLSAMVSALAESKEELTAANGFLEAVFESGPIGILVTGKDGKTIRSNGNLTSLLGIDPDTVEVTRDKFCEVFEDAAGMGALWDRGLCRPEDHLEADGVTTGQEARSLQVVSAPVRNKRDAVFARIWIVRDDTERTQLGEELRQAQKMEAMGRLAGGIAHDFNNLLTAIRGNLELALISEPTSGSLEIRDRLEQAFDAAKSATSLVGQILGYSRKSKLTIEPVCLNSLVESTSNLVRRMLTSKIELRAEEPDTPVIAMADQTQVQQILMNLCVNSRDALPPEGGQITIRSKPVTITPEESAKGGLDRKPGDYIALSVEDTGSGISKENLSKIFDPFFTTKPSGQGTGLGLSTCYGIAAQHHGWLECESEPGNGATFTVYLPAATGVDLEKASKGVTEELPGRGIGRHEAYDGSGNTILVIDDEDSVRMIAKLSLERRGFRVMEAPGGGEGLRLYRENSSEIEAVILDRNMPDLSGEEVFRELAKMDPEVRVVVCSGLLPEADEFVTESGARPTHFLQKPYSIKDLYSAVEEAMIGDVSLPS